MPGTETVPNVEVGAPSANGWVTLNYRPPLLHEERRQGVRPGARRIGEVEVRQAGTCWQVVEGPTYTAYATIGTALSQAMFVAKREGVGNIVVIREDGRMPMRLRHERHPPT